MSGNEAARYEAEAKAEFEALTARQKARREDPNVIAQEAEQAARRAERHALGLHIYASNNAVAARLKELRNSRVAGFNSARKNAYTERMHAWKKGNNGKWTPTGGKRSTRKAKKSTRKTRRH